MQSTPTAAAPLLTQISYHPGCLVPHRGPVLQAVLGAESIRELVGLWPCIDRLAPSSRERLGLLTYFSRRYSALLGEVA